MDAPVRHTHHDLPTGVRLHVAEAGDPAAPPLLLVHGWPQHWWAWRDVMGPLARDFRVLCPDLRGFGLSGQPADGDFAKQRLADDLLALLDALGIERAGYVGHDWGGWAGHLLALRAPERLTRLMTVAIVHPWAPRGASLRNAWRLTYQLPIAAPVAGPALIRDGRPLRAALERAGVPAEAAATYAGMLRRPAQADASSRLYRTFLTRELPALAGGALEGKRLELPVFMLFPRGDGAQHPDQLAGLPAREVEVELVDGGHFLLDTQPALVAARAAAWFG